MPIFMDSESGLEAFKAGHRVVDAGWTPRDETFAELDTDQESEVPRSRVDRVEKALLRKRRLGLGRGRVVELTRVGADRAAPDLHRRADVDDEAGRVNVRGREVDRLLRTVRRVAGLDLAQARVERGIGHELAGAA